MTDHETWIFNLTKANSNRDANPEWFKEYSFKGAYAVQDLSPASLDELAEKFANDPELLHMYWQRKVKLADTALALGCDNDCLAQHLCQIVTAQVGADTRCRTLQSQFWDIVNQ